MKPLKMLVMLGILIGMIFYNVVYAEVPCGPNENICEWSVWKNRSYNLQKFCYDQAKPVECTANINGYVGWETGASRWDPTPTREGQAYEIKCVCPRKQFWEYII